MADLYPIKIPEDLRMHNLTEQELGNLSPERAALAKDWNIIKRQTEWTMVRTVEIYNILVEHDKAIGQFWLWIKIAGFLISSGSAGAGLLWWISKGGG